MIFKVLKYSFLDLIRSYWLLIYFSFFFVSSFVLLWAHGNAAAAIIGLLHLSIVLVPLVSVIFGCFYYYNSRDFLDLLLAQPLRRRTIFIGHLLGLSGSLACSFLLGIGLPFLFLGISFTDFIHLASLLVAGTFLTFIFSSLAYTIALSVENKLKGFGLVILVWLFLAFVYDGLFLILFVLLESYPLEAFSLFVIFLNPIDLSRVFILLRLDIATLMGYTGAVFKDFFGTYMGISFTLLALVGWVLAPLFLIVRVSSRKDF